MLLSKGLFGTHKGRGGAKGGGHRKTLFSLGGEKAGLYSVAGEPLLVKVWGRALPSPCPPGGVGGGGGRAPEKSGGAKVVGYRKVLEPLGGGGSDPSFGSEETEAGAGRPAGLGKTGLYLLLENHS
jgi:hypothetical protein